MVRSTVAHFRFRLISIRFAQSFKENERHIAVLCLNRSERIISPVLEIGWDTITAEVVEMSRWRAILLEQQTIQHGNLIGHGSGSYLCAQSPLRRLAACRDRVSFACGVERRARTDIAGRLQVNAGKKKIRARETRSRGFLECHGLSVARCDGRHRFPREVSLIVDPDSAA